jgi:hypothetical protein
LTAPVASSVLTLPESMVFTLPLVLAQTRSMSAASTAVPSDHLVSSATVYFTVSGSSLTCS